MYLGPAILYGINLVSLFAFVIYAMVNVSLELTLFCLIPLPVLSISIYYVSDLIHKKSEEIQQQLAVLNNTAQEVYAGIRVVKAYTQENSMLGFFTSQSQQYNQQSVSLARINALFYPLMILLIGISTLITVYAGGTLVVNGSISTGNIAEFVIYVNMLTWPVTSIGWIASIIQQASASQKRINEFMQTKPSILSGNTEDFKLKGDIVFNNVGLTYPDTGICALKNIQLHIKSGEKIAIIGKTGSGKSSFAELLLRMNDVSEGEILFDGVPVKDLNLGRLREQIGYVPQDVFLFSDSLKQNITFGKPHASDAEIEKAIFDASLTDEIKTFPDGLNTILGERGITLSGGQKQRVSIARALLKNPEILILDDCLYDNTWARDKMMRLLFMNGRHWKVMLVITMQYPLGIPPTLRTNIDYVFILRENYIANRKRIYENYAGMFPTFESFCQVMDQCTENYECLVINNNSKSNKLQDQVFWYKADNHNDFRLGSKEFWELSKGLPDEQEEQYDPNKTKKRGAGPKINVKKTTKW
jgi:ATP-binding cassette subfamily B protein